MQNDIKQRTIITILVENEAGSLSRIVGLFSQRNFNIYSLSVSPTHSHDLSHINITTYGSQHLIEQITKQLDKLICVFKVVVLTENEFVERELALIKLKFSTPKEMQDLKTIVDIHKGNITDLSNTTMIVHISSKTSTIESFLSNISDKNILEITRSGAIGLLRKNKII
jgi:acetolactate synthase-1/3 small subunit